MTEKTKKPLEITIHYFIMSGGDGSASPRFFRTQKGMQEALEKVKEQDEGNGFAEDCDGSLTFSVDPETGEFIKKVTKYRWEQPFGEDKPKDDY